MTIAAAPATYSGMSGDLCKFEEYVRHLANTGVDGDDCGQLQSLINQKDARGVRDHLSSWMKTCAGQLVDLVEAERKARAEQLIAIEEAKSESVEEVRFKLLVEALDYVLGHSRKGLAYRKKLAKLLPPSRKDTKP